MFKALNVIDHPTSLFGGRVNSKKGDDPDSIGSVQIPILMKSATQELTKGNSSSCDLP
jgi:hypothetical protein